MSPAAPPVPVQAARWYADLLRYAHAAKEDAGEALCALEQFLADLTLLGGPAADRLAGPAEELRALLSAPAAGPLATDPLPPPATLEACVSEAWAGLTPAARRDFLRTPGPAPRWADCMAPNPVDFARYERAAWEALAAEPQDSFLVLGIRTAGSYLAPAWVRALRARGSTAHYVTVRPRRGADGSIAVPDLPDLTGTGVARNVLLVDDGMFSGRTLEAVREHITGTPGGERLRIRSAVGFIGDADALAHRSERWRSSLIVLPGCTRRLPSVDGTRARDFFAGAVTRLGSVALDPDEPVRACPPGYWSSYVLAAVDVPAHVPDGLDHRIRKRRYRMTLRGLGGRPTDVVAKYLGWGPLAALEARRLRDEWYGDDVLGVASGYLFCRWRAGEPLAFCAGAPAPEEIGVLALDAVHRYRLDTVRSGAPEEWRARRAKAADRLSAISDGLGDALRRTVPEDHTFPVVTVPRNQGHWHYVRLADGRLRRFHQDVGRWSRQVDPGWELASVIVELGLGEDASGRLVAAYQAATGDDSVADRLPLGLAEYGLTMLAEFEEHHRTVAEVPERYRRPDAERLAPYGYRVRGALRTVAERLGHHGGTLRLPAAVPKD